MSAKKRFWSRFDLFLSFCFMIFILSVVLFLEKYIGIGVPERVESFLKTFVTVSFWLSFPIAPVVAYADAARDWKKNRSS